MISKIPVKEHIAPWVGHLVHLRGLAILAVLAIHTSAGFVTVNTVNSLVITNVVIDVFSGFAVPAFIFISGYVLSLKYYGGFSLRSFYSSRAFAIVPAYLVFSAVYIVFYGYRHRPTADQLINDLVFGASSYHLPFLIYLMQLYVLYPLFIAVYLRFNERGRAHSLVLLSLVLQVTWALLPTFAAVRMSSFAVLWTVPTFVPYLFYFFVGIHAARQSGFLEGYLNSKRVVLVLTVVVIVLTAIVAGYWISGISIYQGFYAIAREHFMVPWAIEPLLYISVIGLMYRLAHYLSGGRSLVSSMLGRIGDLSFGIYLVHVVFLTLITRYLLPDYNAWHHYPIAFVATLVTSFLTCFVVSHLPFGRRLVGRYSNRTTNLQIIPRGTLLSEH